MPEVDGGERLYARAQGGAPRDEAGPNSLAVRLQQAEDERDHYRVWCEVLLSLGEGVMEGLRPIRSDGKLIDPAHGELRETFDKLLKDVRAALDGNEQAKGPNT
jgi:hypothetical protein